MVTGQRVYWDNNRAVGKPILEGEWCKGAGPVKDHCYGVLTEKSAVLALTFPTRITYRNSKGTGDFAGIGFIGVQETIPSVDQTRSDVSAALTPESSTRR